MGAETDLSPPTPVPEPTLSPEPDLRGHDDQRGWKADMMSALGESVSFGRFLSEPLDWGRWSAFAQNRYLEEAARQARPGSVAQKRAMLEARYARKRRTEAEGDNRECGFAEADEDGAASLSPSTEGGSSCMTDGSPCAPRQEICGGRGGGLDDAVDCGGGPGGDGDVAAEEVQLQAITDAIGCACGTNEEIRDREEKDALQSPEKQDSRDGHLVSVDAVERQPLKESSTANQDVTDSAKKRRLQMPSLLQKPAKIGSPSPSSVKKGQSSSAKRRSSPRSSKENASPTSTDSSKRSATSVSKKRSALAALHMSMNFSRCETGSAASSSRNLGTTIAERISQLQSASRPVEKTLPEEFRPPRKVFSRALPETASRTSQADEQRSSHVMRIKEKLFGSTLPSVTKKMGITREKEKKLNNEPGFKESRQNFCFKTRAQTNYGFRNKQAKDSNQQCSQEIHHLSNSGHHQMGKGVCKEKQICCFPIRKLC